jgi:Protein-glutamine gamma-glutamyltransferase
MTTSPVSSSKNFPVLEDKKERKLKDYTTTTEDRVRSAALACMQRIVEDNTMRKENYKNDLSLYNKGFYYSNEHFEMLNALKDEQLPNNVRKDVEGRLRKYIKNGAFYHGIAPKKYFNMEKDVSSATGVAVQKYLLKTGITPSQALDAILSGNELMYIDCTAACQISFYAGLRDALKDDDKFNKLFAKDGPFPLYIGTSRTSFDPLWCLIEDVLYSKEKCSKGDLVYFQGPSFYRYKHYNGDGASWCTLCVDPEKEIYIGLGLSPKGATFADIQNAFLNAYNEDPTGIKAMSPEAGKKLLSIHTIEQTEIIKNLDKNRVSLKFLKEKGGVKPFSIRKWDLIRVDQLIKATADEGLMLMALWKRETLKNKSFESPW